jgi:hypothetical protein
MRFVYVITGTRKGARWFLIALFIDDSYVVRSVYRTGMSVAIKTSTKKPRPSPRTHTQAGGCDSKALSSRSPSACRLSPSHRCRHVFTGT